MIRRISDLPNLNSSYPAAELSNGLFEISYDVTEGGDLYKSFYTKGVDLINSTLCSLTETDITKIRITEYITVDGGILCIDHGGSIIAWPNEGTDTCCYLRFGEIKLCSDEKPLQLFGAPAVVLNSNLSVFSDKTETNREVRMISLNNVINVKSVDDLNSTAAVNQYRAINLHDLQTAVLGPTTTFGAMLSGNDTEWM